MKITAGKRGDAAREAKDRAENKYYWDKFKRAQVLPKIRQEFDARDEQATADIRRQIDRLISDGYAKQIFEDDVYVKIWGDTGNKTFAIRDEALGNARTSYRSEFPGQIQVAIGNKYYKGNHPFEWEWKARFDYSFKNNNFELKNDVSSYSFNSSDPGDVEYFAACGQIFKALSKLNWNKILTTDPYEGLGELYSQLPNEPNKYLIEDNGKLDNDIKEADIQDALDEWKKGQKWLYVGTPRSSRYYNKFVNDPYYDTTTSLMEDNGFYKGWYKYIGETDKYYKVVYMPYTEDAASKMREGEPPVPYEHQWKDKVRKDEFEYSIYYPITWYGKA